MAVKYLADAFFSFLAGAVAFYYVGKKVGARASTLLASVKQAEKDLSKGV